MFHTELEAIENAFVLKLTYCTFYKQWAYRTLEDLIVHRSRLEHMYVEGDLDTLTEELS
jgi:hypothetical protein